LYNDGMPDSNARATLQMLAVGGVPGRPYEAPAFSELGAGETPA
jgi:hypothetical protein